MSSELDIPHDTGTLWEAEPVEPLVIKDVGKREAPQYGACMTWVVPQSGIGNNQPIQILQRRRTRTKGTITIASLGGAPVTVSAIGTSTGLTAGQTLASAAVTQSSVYTISWNVQLTATVGVTNNLQLEINGTPIQGATYRLASGTYPQLTWTGFIAAGSTITINAINTDATGTTSAQFVATSGTVGAATILFNSKQDPLTGPNPQGAMFQNVGQRALQWENQQPLYAIALGGTATINVIDEAYAER
jgi:hypothetical protein